MGNYGFVDADGFLVIKNDLIKKISECSMMKRIDGKFLKINRRKKIIKKKLKI